MERGSARAAPKPVLLDTLADSQDEDVVWRSLDEDAISHAGAMVIFPRNKIIVPRKKIFVPMKNIFVPIIKISLIGKLFKV